MRPLTVYRAVLLNILLLTGSSSCLPPPGRATFAQLPYALPVKIIDVDGVSIAYSDQGRGPCTLVLIHGLGANLLSWSRNVEELSRHYRVIALDLPGYGRSSKKNYQYSMAFFAQAVDALMDRLHLTHVILVGNSMGGQIAITHALLHPGKAEAIVLASPAGLEPFTPGEMSFLSQLARKELIMATPPDAIYSNVAVNFSDMPDEASYLVDQRFGIIGGPDFEPFAYAVARSIQAMIDGQVYARLPEVRVPVLISWGTDDGLIPNPVLHGGCAQALAEAAARRFPNAHIAMIPHAGHMVQFDKPAAWNRAVIDFVAASVRQ